MRPERSRDEEEAATNLRPMGSQFYKNLLEMIGAPVDLLSAQYDSSNWTERGEILGAIFAQRDLADWVSLLEGKDACFAPVLRLSEVAEHPHMSARSSYVLKNGRVQCAPAPRFSRTPGEIQDAKVADDLLNRRCTS